MLTRSLSLAVQSRAGIGTNVNQPPVEATPLLDENSQPLMDENNEIIIG